MAERIFAASDESLGEVMAFAEAELEKYGCSLKTVMQISVCIEEIFVNIAHYAYPGSQGEVKLELSLSDEKAEVTFTDSGIAFDPLGKADPDITLSADDRDIGGLGIFMVKKTMDEVRYERKNEMNIFTMIKER